jgi:hypothetical protein
MNTRGRLEGGGRRGPSANHYRYPPFQGWPVILVGIR